MRRLMSGRVTRSARLQLIHELVHAIEVDARSGAEGMGLDVEGRRPDGGRTQAEPPPERVIDDCLQALAGATDLPADARRDIGIEREGRSHLDIMMPQLRDVKMPALDTLRLALCLTPHGRLLLAPDDDASELEAAFARRLQQAFARGAGHGLLTLGGAAVGQIRSEEHTSELQSHHDLVCRL